MTTWIILGVIVAIIIYLFAVYNGLVTMRQRANQAFADIDVQLKQRHDLVPNLVETVKGYATHEKETFDAVVKARSAAMAAPPQSAEQAQAEAVLSGALGRLIAISEAYPDLKANQNFLKLQDDLGDVENKLSAARRFFNNAVGEYNAAIEAVPAVFFSKSLGFSPRTFFDLGEEKRNTLDEPPKVSFGG
jgi:LemA protein